MALWDQRAFLISLRDCGWIIGSVETLPFHANLFLWNIVKCKRSKKSNWALNGYSFPRRNRSSVFRHSGHSTSNHSITMRNNNINKVGQDLSCLDDSRKSVCCRVTIAKYSCSLTNYNWYNELIFFGFARTATTIWNITFIPRHVHGLL